jgi:hypothetical protein
LGAFGLLGDVSRKLGARVAIDKVR